MSDYIYIVNYIVYGLCFLLLLIIFLKNRTISAQKILLKKLAEKNEELVFDFNSERDFKFMHYLISFELANCLDTEMIMVNEQKQNKLLKDDELKSYVVTVCKSSLEKMASSYKEKLIRRYFGTEKKLIEYVTEYAFNTSFKLFSKLNKDKINKIRKKDNANNVISQNGKKAVIGTDMKDL